MTTINDTKWKPFIKLTLAGKDSCEGFLVLDVNNKVTLMRDETNNLTYIYFSNNDISFGVAETPDEICTLVDAKIDEQEKRHREEWEAQRAAFEKEEGTLVNE